MTATGPMGALVTSVGGVHEQQQQDLLGQLAGGRDGTLCCFAKAAQLSMSSAASGHVAACSSGLRLPACLPPSTPLAHPRSGRHLADVHLACGIDGTKALNLDAAGGARASRRCKNRPHGTSGGPGGPRGVVGRVSSRAVCSGHGRAFITLRTSRM